MRARKMTDICPNWRVASPRNGNVFVHIFAETRYWPGTTKKRNSIASKFQFQKLEVRKRKRIQKNSYKLIKRKRMDKQSYEFRFLAVPGQ